MASTATDNREILRNEPSGFFCAVCREPLVPVCIPDRFEFAFGCSSGHVEALDRLFATHREELRSNFQVMIATWERTIGQLTDGAAVADRHGSPELAERLRSRVATLRGKVRLFRETFLPETNRF